ncbi:MAG: GNAT family N-acetyltransferase [Phocaeicola sp.]|nr:GNAT family N-acetyltransferase [Phocaeicola sp.]
MAERIVLIADSFILAKNKAGSIMRYVVGPVTEERYITDELFSRSTPNPQEGGSQTILSLATNPDFQGLGVASALLKELERVCRTKKRIGISLTCLERLIPFYERQGYTNEGVSASEHGGEKWYNLVRIL